MTARRASVADTAALAALRGIGPEQLPEFTAWVAAHADTHLPFVAEVDGAIVGVAWLHIAERVPGAGRPDRRFGDVQAVEVQEQFQHQGIGRTLIAAILAEARSRGLLHVTVHSGRRAVDFYLKTGFDHHRQLLLWEPSG